MREVSPERLGKYFSLTKSALEKVKIKNLDSSRLDARRIAEDFLDTAKRYYEDAQYFRKKGDIVTAFAAVAYAHAWLDAGARMGLFETGKDTELFAAEE